MAEVENHFTVFVRLPFNRGDFVDPPPVRVMATSGIGTSLMLLTGSVECSKGKGAMGDHFTTVEKQRDQLYAPRVSLCLA